MSGRPVSGLAAAQVLARWTLRRLARGRALWGSAVLAALPLASLLVMGDGRPERVWEDFVVLCVALLAVLPPLFTAPAIAEEVEDKTFTYLWSRPIPRWSVLVGKLMAGVPLSAAMIIAVLGAGFALIGNLEVALLAQAAGALTVGAVAVSVIAAGLGSLVPKHALGAAICYLLVLDMPVGEIPFSVAKLSVTHHARELAIGDGGVGSIAWAAGIAAAWLAIGALRLVRAEFASAE